MNQSDLVETLAKHRQVAEELERAIQSKVRPLVWKMAEAEVNANAATGSEDTKPETRPGAT